MAYPSGEDGELSPLTLNVEKVVQSIPRGPPTPNMTTPSTEHSSHDPPPPPTPAASPGPDHAQPDWSDAGDQEDVFLSQIRHYFKNRTHSERTRILGDLLNLCTSQQLSFVRQYVDPLLKKDPFTSLPTEICLRVRNTVDLCCGDADSFVLDSRLYRRPQGPRPRITSITKVAGASCRRCDVDEAVREARLWPQNV